jgi:hypothetical protein
LWTLSDEESLYAIKWLEGQELANYKSNELELPSQRQSFDAVLQMLDLISEYNQLVICFDELDASEAYDDISGLYISQIVAGLIKDLLQNLSRGVILSVMMPDSWSNKIKQLPGGVYNKVSTHGNPIDLKYMNRESIIDLVVCWLKKYYELRNLVPPTPVYPFTESQLSEIGEGRETIRQVLRWCQDNCHPPILTDREESKEKELLDPVEIAFTKELDEDLGDYLEQTYLLADALLFGFQTLIGQIVERVSVEQVTEKVTRKGGKNDYINFKVIGKENGKDISIGVAVLQYAGGKALGAGLKRLNDYETFGMTRGCLVRSTTKKISTYLETTYLEPLIRQKGGEFVPLKEEEIRPLIAIRAVHKKREVDYRVSEEEIFQFIAQKGADKMLGVSNPLIKEILSDPSYEVPVDMIEDEPVTAEEFMFSDLSEEEETDEAIDNLLTEFN